MRIPLVLAFLTALCLLPAGCGKGGSGHATAEAVRLSAEDVTKALGIDVRKFSLHGPEDVDTQTTFWVEEYVRSEEGTDTNTYQLGRWGGHQTLKGDLLFMFQGRETRRCYIFLGNTGVAPELPASITLDVGASVFNHMPDKFELPIGEEAIIAVQVQSDEVRGLDASSMQDYVDENVRLGKYERILVYKVRFTPME